MTNQTAPKSQMQKPPKIFDRTLLAQRQQRARKDFAAHQFLHEHIITDIVDRLETIQRHFENAVIIGPGAHLLRPALTPACDVGALIEAGLAPHSDNAVYADEEMLPFAENSLDLMISIMGLHLINDLPGALIQMRRALKADGLLIAALPAEQTLQELRHCLYEAETQITGGVSPRIAPFAAIKDLGGLLQRAGFALPVADVMQVPVTYRQPITLLKDLRGMGETNILAARKKTGLGKKLLSRTMSLYQERYSKGEGVTASFDIVMLTGWVPHESQQKPLKPGSAKSSMADAIKANIKP